MSEKTGVSDEDRALIVKFLARMLGGAKRVGYWGDETHVTQSVLMPDEVVELNALINRLQTSGNVKDRE